MHVYEALKRIYRDVTEQQAVFDAAPDDDVSGKPDDTCDCLTQAEDALTDLIRWVNELTGISTEDLRELARRSNTAIGFTEYEPLKLRSLKAEVDRLVELDRHPDTRGSLARVLNQHPEVMKRIGADEYTPAMGAAGSPFVLAGSVTIINSTHTVNHTHELGDGFQDAIKDVADTMAARVETSIDTAAAQVVEAIVSSSLAGQMGAEPEAGPEAALPSKPGEKASKELSIVATDSTAPEVHLTDRHIDVLRALKELYARSKKTLAKASIVAEKACGENDPDRVKQPLADLARHGLVDSWQGCAGGSWITEKGLLRLSTEDNEN